MGVSLSVAHFMGSTRKPIHNPGFEDSPAGFMLTIRFADSLTVILNR